MTVHAYCICTTVSAKALAALLENGGRGTYRDEHPWLIARDLVAAARQAGERVPVLFASGRPARFSHWSFIDALEVLELHRARWETACSFSALQPVNPIFEEIDSLFLKPSSEQLDRERREGIPRHRHPLTERELHPYAICETPPFIEVVAAG
jgi:hypothetical protein